MGGKNRVGGRCAIGAQKTNRCSARRCKTLLLAALAVVAAPGVVRATAYSWNINAGGLFETATNWSPSGPPLTSADTASFDQTGTFTVTFQGNKSNNNFNVVNGSVTFGLSGQTYSLQPTTVSAIGQTPGQTARLTLLNGTVNAGLIWIGINPADTGFLTVSTNSQLSVAGGFNIGNFGTGTLAVSGGGMVTSNGSSIIASGASAVGAATVSGVGSKWIASGAFTLGDSGTGSLTINNGGVVNSNSALAMTIANATGSSGTLAISGIGSFLSSNGVVLGNGGAASATVSSGATVAGSFTNIGSAASGNGVLTITGAGSAWNLSSNWTVGNNGTGTLNVLGGATASGSFAVLGNNGGSHGTINVDGIGSTYTLTSGGLTLGSTGTGNVNISAGAKANIAGSILMALNPGSSGTLSVSGAGSSLFSDGSFTLGANGSSVVNVLDGGTITVGAANIAQVGTASMQIAGVGSTFNANAVNVGATSSGNASLTVDKGATMNVGGLLTVADPAGAATGTLTLNAGGTINVSNGFTRQGTLNFNGGNLNINGGIFNNGAAPGPLTITGATAADFPVFRLSGSSAATSNVSSVNLGVNTSGAIEVLNGAHLSVSTSASLGFSAGTGSVLIDGAGSNFAAGGNLQFGVNGNGIGTMTISNGGSVSSPGAALGLAAGTSGSVTVTGAGSTWTNGSKLDVGSGGNGVINIGDGGNVSAATVEIGFTTPGTISVKNRGSLSSTGLLVGLGASGTLNIESGGTVNTSPTAFIANGAGTGTATVTGAGSSWNASAIQIGTASSGSGTLNVLASGSVTTNTFTLNDPTGSPTGTLLIDGGNVTVNGTFTRRGTLDFRDGTLTINAGTFDNASPAAPLVIHGSAPGKLPTMRLTGTSGTGGITDLTVGQNRAGSLYIESRSNLFASGNFFIGSQTGGNGSVTVEGILQANGSLRVGGNVVSGGTGNLLIQSFGEVVVGTTLSVYPQGTVHLNNGRLVLDNFSPEGGVFDFASGSVTFSSGFTLEGFHLDGLLGSSHTLRGGQLLFSNSDFTLGANLTVDGGTLEAANDLIVSANTFLTLSRGNAKCSNNFTNQAGGVVSLQGGTLSSDLDMANAGEIQLHGGTSLLLVQNNFNSTGLITGSGQVSAALNNQTAGVVRASGTDRLVVTGAVNNSGLISLLNGGTVEFRSAMTNTATGRIAGRGVVDARAGVTNNGQIAFSGELSDFFGPITNNSGGKIIVTGAGLATFYDTITHNAGAEIRVSAGSSAVFLGPVNGVGTFSGSGTKYFEGGGSAVGPVITPGSTVVEAAASLSATLIREHSLTVNGVVTINTSGGTSHLNQLNIAADGVLDLKNNSLVLEGGDLAVVTSQIRSGLYEGTGITSSAPGAPFRLGSMSNAGTVYSTFQGISGLTGDEVLIRYTRIGDLNLDGTVTISDFIDLASHFNTVGGATWQMGDVNYDGSVTISDFIDLASNFNQSVSGEASPISGSDAAMLGDFAAANGVSAVPEPTCLLIIPAAASLIFRCTRKLPLARSAFCGVP